MLRIDLAKVPRTPGVYLFLGHGGKVVYVGKAKDLAARLAYYRNDKIIIGKTVKLLEEAQNFRWIQTETELEALILEMDLIKKYRPKYNASLKDGKAYVYLFFPKVNPKTREGLFPPVVVVRKKISGKGKYFGPFPNIFPLRKLLRKFRRLFPFRDCRKTKFNRFARLNHGCLYADLSLCSAPCVLGRVSPRRYRRNLAKIEIIFNGRIQSFLSDLVQKMKRESAKENFESAALIREEIEQLRMIMRTSVASSAYQENPNLYQDLRRQELLDLENFLKPFFPAIRLNDEESPIFCFDISNLGPTGAVGALVTFKAGEPEKSLYRKFRIKSVDGVNDPAMIKEIVTRAFSNKSLPRPGLVVIDGGLSQLAKAAPILSALRIPFMGLAKSFERILVGGDYFRLSKGRPLMKLLVRIRDESHRFALSYQRQVHRRSFQLSAPGVATVFGG